MITAEASPPPYDTSTQILRFYSQNTPRASNIGVDLHWAADLYYPAWEKKHLSFWDGLHLNSKVSATEVGGCKECWD